MKNHIKTYPSGLRLVVRPMPNFKSVSTNIYIAAGSRDEQENEHGLSHFVEHMLFKGTKTRSTEDISDTLDGLGVDINAFTSNDATCYWTRGLNSNVETCIDILSDMYFNTKFKEADFYKEAEVIVQEIIMREDEPHGVMFDLARETFFAGTTIEHDIAGTIQDIRSYKPQDIYNYIKKHYVAPKTIISFAGDITVAQAEELVKKYFPKYMEGNTKPLIKNMRADAIIQPKKNFVTKIKDVEQHNMIMFFPTPNNVHEDRYVWAYIYEILASGMSSRLFRSVREKLGLVYAISGGISLCDIGGYFYIWFSCTPDNTAKVLSTIAREIALFKKNGASEEEIQKVKNQRITSEMFTAENVSATNKRNATSLAEFNHIKTTEEYMSCINAVTAKDILRVANQYLNYDNIVISAVGKSFDKELEPFKVLGC